jgi:hypothetical protein
MFIKPRSQQLQANIAIEQSESYVGTEVAVKVKVSINTGDKVLIKKRV